MIENVQITRLPNGLTILSEHMPQVRSVVRAAAKDNYKFSAIVRGIVNTDSFRKQGPPPKLTARAEAGK